jgi:hypothetical protein
MTSSSKGKVSLSHGAKKIVIRPTFGGCKVDRGAIYLFHEKEMIVIMC